MIKRRVLGGLWRCILWVFEQYRNAHRQSLLLRVFRGQKVSAPEPQSQPASSPEREPSGNVVKFPQRPSPHVQPIAPKTSNAFAMFGDISLGLAATAVPIVMVCLLMVASSSNPSDRIITTKANETTATRLPGGGRVSLGARSTLKVNVGTYWPWDAMLLDGEAMFDTSLGASRSLMVETFLATAKAEPGAKFRVTIDSSVEFELFVGVVNVFLRATNGTAATITLRKGVPYRVPVDMRGAMAATLVDE